MSAAYVKKPEEDEVLCHFLKCESVLVFDKNNIVLQEYLNATGSISLSSDVGASMSNGKYIRGKVA